MSNVFSVSRTASLLNELAAGRRVVADADEQTVTNAIDHRVAGILWTRVLRHEISVPGPESDRLEDLDLRAWARARMLEGSLAELLAAGERLGMRLAVIKGLATANRWYSRPTERWAYDLDVVVDPRDLDRVDDLVSDVYPAHPLRGHLVDLLTGGHIQSVDMGVREMPVDLHLDPFKLEILWSRTANVLWDHLEEIETESGLRIPTFDDSVSLLLHLVHLNKDSFRRLIGYADVARGLSTTSVDWAVILDLAAAEGIEQSVLHSAQSVISGLDLDAEVPAPRRDLRGRIWRLGWPEERRLDETAAPGRHRLFLLSLLARGRFAEALIGWARRLFPPRALLDYYYPGSGGPYLVKLVSERVRRRRSTSTIR